MPLVLATSGSTIRLAGSAVRDLPVESLTCEACGTKTLTGDLPPVGIDIAAVLEELAAAATRSRRQPVPACPCGARALTLSTVLTVVVHTAGTSMVGEVSPGHEPAAAGTLRCAGCATSWEAGDPDLPAQVSAAVSAFTDALSAGDVGWSD